MFHIDFELCNVMELKNVFLQAAHNNTETRISKNPYILIRYHNTIKNIDFHFERILILMNMQLFVTLKDLKLNG